MPEPLINVEALSKTYGSARALDAVDLRIDAGEIHGLCGENGAGKSTLIKMLSGSVTPDAGRVLLDGSRLLLGSVRAAEHAGIAVIHQESVAFAHLNAQDNIFVGREPRRLGGLLLDRRAMLAQTRALLARLGERIDSWTPVGDLPLAQRQMVGIARALSHKCRLLIMDEPTASLSARETDTLFRVIRQLQAEGVSILYVSHRLEEIFLLADRVTVLRDGKRVGTQPACDLTKGDLIRMMVGRELLQVEGAMRKAPPRSGDAAPLLQVSQLTRCGAFADISFSVQPGEVVGMAGLVGAGRSEVARAIFGADPVDGGVVRVAGQPLTPASIHAAMDAGIALVPEDRQQLGLVLPMSVGANLSLTVLSRLTVGGLISDWREQRLARAQIDDLRVKTVGTRVPAQTLSGGNQQKLVIGKWLATQPRVLILDEPTRGVDVGAKAEIYALIRKLAGAGMGVLVISSDLAEVLLLADRILVLRQGRIAGELARGQATQEKVLALAMPGGGEAQEGQTATRQRGPGGEGGNSLAPAAPGRSGMGDAVRALAARREYGLTLVLALIVMAVSVRNLAFLAWTNLRDILITCTQPAIVACGVMLVIVTGEIDISVGSSMGLLAAALGLMVSPTRLGWPVGVGILAVLALGTVIGLVNGLLVAVVRVPSIIVTLGMLTALRGVTVMLLKAKGDITDLPAAARFLGIGTILGIGTSVWVAGLVAAATYLMLRHTPIGRRLYAVGSNAHAAALAGLSAARIKILAFALTGFLVGVATLVTQNATVNTGIGQGFELLVVTCVVVGGVSITGGVGTLAGVMLGVLLLQIQSTVLIFLDLGANASLWNKAIQGGLILLAVLVDRLAGRRTVKGGAR